MTHALLLLIFLVLCMIYGVVKKLPLLAIRLGATLERIEESGRKREEAVREFMKGAN